MFGLRVLALALVSAGAATPVDDSRLEVEVKAAIVINLTKFVSWPPPTQEAPALVIGVLGSDPISPALRDMTRGQAIDKRPLEWKEFSDIPGSGACNILFVSRSYKQRLKTLLSNSHPGVLTVSDLPDFAEAGGMVGLVNVQNRIGFEINVDAVHDAGLDIHSQVLMLARRAIGGGRKR